MSGVADDQFGELIERSSLGATGARQLRQRTSQDKSEEIRRIQRERLTGRNDRQTRAEERLAYRRERLLRAGYGLFAYYGFHAVTIERLCATAHISNRAFYELFPGRGELLEAIHAWCVEETLASMAEAMQSAAPTPKDRIVVGVGQYVRFVTSDIRRARIMHQEVAHLGCVHDTPYRSGIEELARVIEDEATQLLGTRPPNLHLLVRGVSGAVQELIGHWLAAQEPSIDAMIDVALHLLLAGVNALPKEFPDSLAQYEN